MYVFIMFRKEANVLPEALVLSLKFQGVLSAKLCSDGNIRILATDRAAAEQILCNHDLEGQFFMSDVSQVVPDSFNTISVSSLVGMPFTQVVPFLKGKGVSQVSWDGSICEMMPPCIEIRVASSEIAKVNAILASGHNRNHDWSYKETISELRPPMHRDDGIN